MAQDRVPPGRQGKLSLSFWAGKEDISQSDGRLGGFPWCFLDRFTPCLVHENFLTGKNIFSSWIFIFFQLEKFCRAFSRIKAKDKILTSTRLPGVFSENQTHRFLTHYWLKNFYNIISSNSRHVSSNRLPERHARRKKGKRPTGLPPGSTSLAYV